MNTITIPKNLIKNDDLIILPRRDYETLLHALKQKSEDWIYQEPFASELKNRIKKTEVELKTNKIIEWKK